MAPIPLVPPGSRRSPIVVLGSGFLASAAFLAVLFLFRVCLDWGFPLLVSGSCSRLVVALVLGCRPTPIVIRRRALGLALGFCPPRFSL